MNTLIKIAIFLCYCILPMNSFGMPAPKGSLVIRKKPLFSYTELIKALNEKTSISSELFNKYLNQAKANNVKLYFIARELIDSSVLKDQILDLLTKTSTKPFFQAHIIPGGFLYLISTDLFESTTDKPLILMSSGMDDKYEILKKFNLLLDNKEKITTVRLFNFQFPTESTTTLNNLYKAISAELERLKTITEEKKREEEFIPSEPIIPITEQPIIEPIKTEEQLKEQTEMAERYAPIFKQIENIGEIPTKDKDEANRLIKKMEKGLLEPEELKAAQLFFSNLENKIKNIMLEKQKLQQEKEEEQRKLEEEKKLKKQYEHQLAVEKQESLTEKPISSISPTIEMFDIYTIPLEIGDKK